MEDESASGHGWCLTKSNHKVPKLTAQELLFPENLSIETLIIHLINRSIIRKDENKSKIEFEDRYNYLSIPVGIRIYLSGEKVKLFGNSQNYYICSRF